MSDRPTLRRADAVALIVLLLTVIPLFAAAAANNKELKNRSSCAANLRGIMQSLGVYGADNNDQFPVSPPDSATDYKVKFNPIEMDTVAEATSVIYITDSFKNLPTCPLWQLVLRGDISPKSLLCPSDAVANTPATVSKDVNGKTQIMSHLESEKNFSYSLAFPYTADKDNKPVVSKLWTNTTDASLPLLSDIAPYTARDAGPNDAPFEAPADTPDLDKWATKDAVSPNHASGDPNTVGGQNVAFGDAHVEWCRKPSIGNNNESIFGLNKKDAEIDVPSSEAPISAGKLPHPPRGSQGNYDTVMVPMRDTKGRLR